MGESENWELEEKFMRSRLSREDHIGLTEVWTKTSAIRIFLGDGTRCL